MSTETALAALHHRIEPLRRRLAHHALYEHLKSLEDMRGFMEHHVFAVWDFMCLLKGLQRHLTSVDEVWRAVGTASTRRLVNELVLEEESDEVDGVPTSHFELYRAAMIEAGARSGRIDTMLAMLGQGATLEAAGAACGVPAGARAFMRATFGFIGSGKAHVIASAFTFGREEAIPDMFRPMIAAISDDEGHLHAFARYLDRHIELDGDDHGPKAIRMLCELCGDDPVRWEEAAEAAERALEARLAFWSAITGALVSARRPAPEADAAD